MRCVRNVWGGAGSRSLPDKRAALSSQPRALRGSTVVRKKKNEKRRLQQDRKVQGEK